MKRKVKLNSDRFQVPSDTLSTRRGAARGDHTPDDSVDAPADLTRLKHEPKLEGVRVRGNGSQSKHHRDARQAQLNRRLLLALMTGVVLLGCRWLAYQIRFDFHVPSEYVGQLRQHWAWVIVLQLGFLLAFRQFSGIYKYFSLPEICRLGYAMALSGLCLFSIRYFDIGFSPPMGVILAQCMLGFLALGTMRASWRMYLDRYARNRARHTHAGGRNVAIIGAGDVGASLVRELFARPNLGLVPVAFYDDDVKKWGAHVHGVPVIGPPETLPQQIVRRRLDEAVIAMPSAPAKRLGEVVQVLQEAHLKYVTVPSIDQLTSGTVSVSQLRPVKIEDLLGRESIDLRLDQIGNVLRDRTVLVTGAGGSIGSELCRQVAAYHPRRLLLVEQSEVQLFPIEQELIRSGYGAMIIPVIADILDLPRMDAILSQYKPEVIFHAAAHKHVGLMEIQAAEAIKNNALATAVLASLAGEHRVARFVMISTDKAVNPTSVMGATKRLAEVFMEALAKERTSPTRFVAVRFGNVLGSSGSVVPIFERQIALGGPVTVTDPEVVRYFMTIPEAVGLVLQSCAQASGGEIYVLDMGKPVKIAELARQMIKLSGLEPDKDIEIKYIGLRPGEKLYEELHHLRANCTDTAHPRIKRLTAEPAVLEKIRADLARLNSALQSATNDELKVMIQAILPEYTPALTSKVSAVRKANRDGHAHRLDGMDTNGNGVEDSSDQPCCDLCVRLRLCLKPFAECNSRREAVGGRR
jgi:FlaA1/EpsC-like NDP-sugar epimerase